MTATLGRVLEHLEIVRVLVAPDGLDATVSGVVVHDPLEPARFEWGELVLGIGVAAGGSAGSALIADAAAGGAVGVIVKADADAAPERLVAQAKDAGICLLAIDREVSWGQLYSLLRTATASLGTERSTAPGGAALGDLFTLANAVAAMVGGAATIENPESTVLAYSSLDEPIDEPRRDTILGRRVPPSWLRRLQDDGVFQRMWASEGPVRIDYDGEPGFRPRLAIAVRAGGQILGSLWVAEGRAPLGPEAEEAMREAARIAALHLVRHQMADDLERRRGSELLRAVLDGRRPPDLLAELVGDDKYLTVFAFELPEADPADLAVQGEQIVNLIDLYTQAYRHQALTTSIGRVVYMLTADAAIPDQERLRRVGSAIVEQTRESSRLSLRVGIGSSVAGFESVGTSRCEADLVLRALVGDPDARRVATLADVGSSVVLMRLREIVADDSTLLGGKLDVLAALDAKGNSKYLATLRAYLDALGDIPSAAASLGVHPNTYRYRLRRLIELGGLDVDDPLERLVVHLQLHLRALDETGPGTAGRARARSAR